MSERVNCELCGIDYPANEGCSHDYWYCPEDLINCADCRADMKDDLAGEIR